MLTQGGAIHMGHIVTMFSSPMLSINCEVTLCGMNLLTTEGKVLLQLLVI